MIRAVFEMQSHDDRLSHWLTDAWERLLYLPHELYTRFAYERPSRAYRKAIMDRRRNGTFEQHAKALEEKGVLILQGYFKGDHLRHMQADFEGWCATKQVDGNGFVDFDGGKHEGYLTRSLAISRAGLDSYLRDLAAYYWGREIQLTYAHGYRTEPIPPRQYRAFQWHHDLKRKQIKMMIYLSDVPEEGQRMDYIPGTHHKWQHFTNHRDVRFTEKQVAAMGSVLHCHGIAGTVVMFDTNGIHRGNRNLGPRRDQYTFAFTGGHAAFPVPPVHAAAQETNE